LLKLDNKSIIIDSSWIGRGGIGRFSQELIKRLNYRVVCVTENPASPFAILKNTAALIRFRGTFLFPGYIPPLLPFFKYVFTIHDLNHIDRADNSSFIKRVFYSLFMRLGCHFATKILTVSDFSRSRISEWFNIDINKIITVGNGVDAAFSADFLLPKKADSYFLCVSNRKSHKNEHRLIRAFARSSIDPAIQLTFTGDPIDELLSLIKELGLENRVVFKGRVADEELPALYRGSLGLLFPSLYEGFGLPVIEAMACGVPVLTSNTTSLPEVAGDAALLVNPESVDEISSGIERLVHDEALRIELIARGLERAKLFSWDAVAARVQAVLDEVANNHGK
jgi:Glycosyltransferase